MNDEMAVRPGHDAVILRPLRDDSIFDCDQGGCDRKAFCERMDLDTGQWLSACIGCATDGLDGVDL